MRLVKFDPSQPRDDHGRWSGHGGGGHGTGGARGSALGGLLQKAAAVLFGEETDHGATLQGVMSKMSPEARAFVAETEKRISKVVPTNALASEGGFKNPDGTWTEARQKVHDDIIAQILTPETVAAATPAKGEQPTYTILGGRGGSGKSWFTGRDGAVDAGHALVLNSDFVKEKLPGYEGWNAAQFHEESSDIFNRADNMARSLGINVIHDSTMKTAKNSHAFVKNYKDAGYRTEGYYMFVPPEVATRRAVDRAMKPGGRFVPPEYVFSSRSNEKSFDDTKKVFDKWAVYNNNVPRGVGPQLVARSGG